MGSRIICSFLAVALLLHVERTTSFSPRIPPATSHTRRVTPADRNSNEWLPKFVLFATKKTEDDSEDNDDGKKLNVPQDEGESNDISSKKESFDAVADQVKEMRKKRIGMAARSLVNTGDEDANDNSGLLDKLNPFQAGKNLRKSLDSAITSLARASSGSGVSSQDGQKSVYYLDDRFQESGGALFTQESNPYLSRLEEENYVPEVLVVGAAGDVGRLVVRRLLLEGRCRVRCLVPDLYSRTLNMLGTGVVYCQGDLSNMDSLEYALTDVDKIVCVAGPPRADEESLQDESFREKFLGFAKDNLNDNDSTVRKVSSSPKDVVQSDLAWERLESVLELRTQLAEQVDLVGMQNLVRAYQNVRYADYGTSQAAKRSLFKFQSREQDFALFDIDDSDNNSANAASVKEPSTAKSDADSLNEAIEPQSAGYADEYEEADDKYDNLDEYDEYAKYDDDDEYMASLENGDDPIEERKAASAQTQVKWIRNEFGHGVFVGKVPSATDGGNGGEAAIISSRLRSRDGEPDDGIDLSGGFGGFVCRVCADGGVYEAFIRDASYERIGIEYVSEFNTGSKQPRKGNASRNRFVSVRLPFESFKPVRRRSVGGENGQETIQPFQGKDVRHIGFRFRSPQNQNARRSTRQESGMASFYIALSYMKLYRIQPEPEIVYLSDARIPPVVLDSQVKHNIRQIVPLQQSVSSGLTENSYQIFDERTLKEMSSDKQATTRIPEETYYKYRGEEILKNSGLSYAIVRVSGFNESPSSEASTIELKSSNDDINDVSRAEVAQVIVGSLLDPNALNKSFYVSKRVKGSSKNIDETMSAKFLSLATDTAKR
ncbi:patatin-like phospholipase domain-containing protein [Seminavis robusta]|uniref:Patatin-like phospholipase domain-containing protein n=1 Tax=Seminavis robusta TaxID=568900 RepID=A0A9N8HNN3_9STRA|nr:patatin-like phospholipase domain-containing protein [Seminavis robusta]|eukprot:Sro1100_g241230.1 patatin-like phospholipase domain-containing protein (830) ;mRNA; r:4404-7136